MMIAFAEISIVIPRESGVSSTPRRRISSPAPAFTGSSAEACHPAGQRPDRAADDDKRVLGSK
jgi:hypothetical protein